MIGSRSTTLLTPDLLNVAIILWAIEIVPILSIGLNSPMRLDMPAATINAQTSIENLPKRAVFQIILQFYRIVNKYNSKYILPGKQKATLASSEGG